jgi:hypothetical protein
MSIPKPWTRLAADALEKVPPEPGVYELATLVRTVVFIGRTAGKDLHSCLHDELMDPRSQMRQLSIYFRFEETPSEDQRHRELLDEYARSHGGKLPPLNQRPEAERRGTLTRITPLVARGRLRAVS